MITNVIVNLAAFVQLVRFIHWITGAITQFQRYPRNPKMSGSFQTSWDCNSRIVFFLFLTFILNQWNQQIPMTAWIFLNGKIKKAPSMYLRLIAVDQQCYTRNDNIDEAFLNLEVNVHGFKARPCWRCLDSIPVRSRTGQDWTYSINESATWHTKTKIVYLAKKTLS